MVRWLGATAYSDHAGPGDTTGRDNSGASSCDTRSGHLGTGSARAVGNGAPPVFGTKEGRPKPPRYCGELVGSNVAHAPHMRWG